MRRHRPAPTSSEVALAREAIGIPSIVATPRPVIRVGETVIEVPEHKAPAPSSQRPAAEPAIVERTVSREVAFDRHATYGASITRRNGSRRYLALWKKTEHGKLVEVGFPLPAVGALVEALVDLARTQGIEVRDLQPPPLWGTYERPGRGGRFVHGRWEADR